MLKRYKQRRRRALQSSNIIIIIIIIIIIQVILDLHNQYRARVARGQESRGRGGPQPPAANMRQLVRDE